MCTAWEGNHRARKMACGTDTPCEAGPRRSGSRRGAAPRRRPPRRAGAMAGGGRILCFRDGRAGRPDAHRGGGEDRLTWRGAASGAWIGHRRSIILYGLLGYTATYHTIYHKGSRYAGERGLWDIFPLQAVHMVLFCWCGPVCDRSTVRRCFF